MTPEQFQSLHSEFLSLPNSRQSLPRQAEIARAILPFVSAMMQPSARDDGKRSAREALAALSASCANALAQYGEVRADRDMLRDALLAYTETLSVWNREAKPENWATIQMNRANTLLNLAEISGGAEGCQFLRDAIDGYAAALTVRTRRAMPTEWAMVQMNRASALMRLGQMSGGAAGLQYLKDAVAGFDGALEVRTRKAMPEAWAAVQMNRACVLMALGQISGGVAGRQYLDDALAGFDKALVILTRETMATDWAWVQMNRANVLMRLGESGGDAAGRRDFEGAVTGYAAALTLITRESMPKVWVMIHMNRANVYMRLGEIQGGEIGRQHLKDAIESLDTAGTIITREQAPADWGWLQMSRGNALVILGRISGVMEERGYLAGGIVCYDLALAVRTREKMPGEWASVQLNRAHALARLGAINGGAERCGYLESAIAGFDSALTVHLRESMSADWGKAQLNRANALMSLGNIGAGPKKRELWQDAAESYKALIEFYGEVGQTGGQLRATIALGMACLRLESWPDTAQAAQAVLERVDEWLLDAPAATDVAERISLLTGLGDMAAYALAQLGRAGDAVLAAEADRAHQLRNHLRLAEARLNDAGRDRLNHQRRQLDLARRALDQRQPAWASAVNDEGRSAVADELKALTIAIGHKHQGYLALLTELNLRSAPPSFHGVIQAAAAPSRGAIVQISVTAIGTVVLIIPHGTKSPVGIAPIFLPLHSEDLNILLQADANTGWLDGFSAFSADISKNAGRGSHDGLQAWNDRIGETLELLWRDLMQPIDQALRYMGLDQGAEVTLIVPGLLSVLPLHAAGNRNGHGRWTCFFDRWAVAYAPSLATLSRPFQAVDAKDGELLLAVTDPLRDLGIHSNPAVLAFPTDAVDELSGSYATKGRVVDKLHRCTYASFFCHGRWDAANPDGSGLILADGERLTPAEIRAAGMERCRFAMLGACESGLSSLRQTPDELQGLPVALLQAGVGAVAATFWPVYNHTAAAMVSGVFASLRHDGLAPAEAVRRIQIGLRDGTLNAPTANDQAPRAAAWNVMQPPDSGETGLVAISPLATDLSQPLHWAVIGVFGR